MLRTTKRTVANARSLRRALTLPEGLLWRALRRRPSNLKFRRQHPCGPFVLDFYCESAKLGIEVDGMAHDMGARPSRDAGRDLWLSEQGIRVLRIPARHVLQDLEAVIRQIIAACHPSTTPLRVAVPLPFREEFE
ncbi:MAG TPA: endonuclease domain-containing protein [Sphingomicrobium sp.]|nr:endonuclease domain-containing protein [Sphingomicrobium sp.]